MRVVRLVRTLFVPIADTVNTNIIATASAPLAVFPVRKWADMTMTTRVIQMNSVGGLINFYELIA